MAEENWLVNLDIGEVSLVYDPMNPLALVEIMKSKKGDDDDGDEGSPALARMVAVVKEAHARSTAQKVLRDIFDNFGALRDNLNATLLDSSLTDVQKTKKLASFFDEYRESLDKLVPDAVIAKSVAETMASITKGDDPDVILKEIAMNAEQLADALATAETTIATLTGQVATLTKGKDEAESRIKVLESEVVVLKGKDPDAPDEVKYAGMSPTAIAKMKSVEADLALANAAIAKSADEAGIREKVDLLKGKQVPKFTEVGAALYRISKGKGLAARVESIDGKDVTIPSDVEVIEQALVAKAQAAKVSLKVVGQDNISKGNDGDDDDASGSAGDKLKAAAATIAKGKGISVDAAMSQAMDENPELYTAYMREKRMASGA